MKRGRLRRLRPVERQEVQLRREPEPPPRPLERRDEPEGGRLLGAARVAGSEVELLVGAVRLRQLAALRSFARHLETEGHGAAAAFSRQGAARPDLIRQAQTT